MLWEKKRGEHHQDGDLDHETHHAEELLGMKVHDWWITSNKEGVLDMHRADV